LLAKSGVHSGNSDVFHRTRVAPYRSHRRVNRLLENESGFISTQLMVSFIFPTVILITVLLLATLGVSMKKEKYYSWVGNAMDFAAEASVLGTDSARVIYFEGIAKQYFKDALTGMVDGTASGNTITPHGSAIPGDVTIQEFKAVEPGDAIPGGVAGQYGYTTTLEFPLLNTELPILGKQYLVTKMHYYAVAKGIEG